MLGRLSADEQALVLAATRDAHALSRCKAVNRGLRPIATRALQALLELDNSEMALLLEVLAGHTAASAALTREPSAKMRLAVLALMPCRHPGRYQKREGDACVLQYIKLENIMNHELAEMELHPSVTTLVGQPGTGKSVFDFAISHALQGRGRRILLREGAQSGRILLWLSVPVPFGRPATLLLETAIERVGAMSIETRWMINRALPLNDASDTLLLRDPPADTTGLREWTVSYHADFDQAIRLGVELNCWLVSVPREDGHMMHTLSIAFGDVHGLPAWAPGGGQIARLWPILGALGRLGTVSAAARPERCAHIECELRRLLELAGMSVTQFDFIFGDSADQLAMALKLVSPPDMPAAMVCQRTFDPRRTATDPNGPQQSAPPPHTACIHRTPRACPSCVSVGIHLRVRGQVRPLLRVAFQLALRDPTAHLQFVDNFSAYFPAATYADAFARAQRMVHASVAAFPTQLLIIDYPGSIIDDVIVDGSWSPTGSCRWHMPAARDGPLRLETDTRAKLVA
jgi:hypothetical protein